ncbi:hypothetical protein [Actinoplanes sp. HUAS TT8]|uniref:hypothetical protein n=1 Tax=Actinoplanes sp. HUAS TT8 TaxID=3447453 RepID=UPI003F5256D8
MTTATAERILVAVLAGLLPPGFRERQRAEWSADLADLRSAGPAVRCRYLMAAAWTLPTLRRAVRRSRATSLPFLSPRRLRAGLGRPGTPGIVALATLVSLLAGLFGAAYATRAGWEYATPLPVGTQAQMLGRTVFPGLTVRGGNDAPFWNPSGEQAEFGAVRFVVDPADTRPVTTTTAAIRDRLAATGWRAVRNPDVGMPGFASSAQTAVLKMARDGLVVTYDGGDDFTVARAVPPWMGWVAASGALVGGLIGWALTGWAGRRADVGSAGGQLAAMVAWPTVVVMLVQLLGGLLGRPGGQTWHDMFYLHLLYIVEGPPKWTGAVALVAVVIVAVQARLSRRPGQYPPPGRPGPLPAA